MNKLTLWIARDANGTLCLFTGKPQRERPQPYLDEDYWDSTLGECLFLDNSLFPDLKWEDEPKEITIEL